MPIAWFRPASTAADPAAQDVREREPAVASWWSNASRFRSFPACVLANHLTTTPCSFLLQALVNGFAGHFFKRRHARGDFNQAAAAQCDHPALDGLFLQFLC